jgi:hypothetical protein
MLENILILVVLLPGMDYYMLLSHFPRHLIIYQANYAIFAELPGKIPCRRDKPQIWRSEGVQIMPKGIVTVYHPQAETRWPCCLTPMSSHKIKVNQSNKRA